MTTPGDVFSAEKLMPIRKGSKVTLTLSIVSSVSFVGLVILSVFFVNVVGKLDILTKELDAMRAQTQTKVETDRSDRKQVQLVEIETLNALATSLQVTTQILSQEVKSRRDLETREKLASARPSQAQ